MEKVTLEKGTCNGKRKIVVTDPVDLVQARAAGWTPVETKPADVKPTGKK